MRFFVGGNMNSLITITDMSCIAMNGVEYIIGFDSSCVALSTAMGRIVIEGKDMKIESLEKKDGQIMVSGKISGVFMSEKKSESGILKRIFK